MRKILFAICIQLSLTRISYSQTSCDINGVILDTIYHWDDRVPVNEDPYSGVKSSPINPSKHIYGFVKAIPPNIYINNKLQIIDSAWIFQFEGVINKNKLKKNSYVKLTDSMFTCEVNGAFCHHIIDETKEKQIIYNRPEYCNINSTKTYNEFVTFSNVILSNDKKIALIFVMIKRGVFIKNEMGIVFVLRRIENKWRVVDMGQSSS